MGRVPDAELDAEQRHLTVLYRQLDAVREQAARRLAVALRAHGGTPQARSEREATIASHTARLAEYGAVEDGLCFGRLDLADGTRRYIGRVGIFDPEGDHEPMLVDWRAPAARPFYLATAVAPDGVVRRRHLRTKHRELVGVEDEILDLSLAGSTGRGVYDGLTGEAALLAALDATRTGRMPDIVQTIQAEQDRVIRADLPGVLVVQGGPGTGKTAVALHRAAYLLYTYRRELATRAVLIVGPNTTFLRYIAQVLPSLAETGVLLCTLGDLYPGVTAVRAESPEVAAVKGRTAMVEVLAAAIRDRQRVPDGPIAIATEHGDLALEPPTCALARERTRRAGRRHNEARADFDTEVVHALAGQVAARIGADPLGGGNLLAEADLAEIRRELRADRAVRSALDTLWPMLTPQRLITDLFADLDRLARAAPQLTEAERAALARPSGGGWTPADVPLLDEAAELLGDAPTEPAARAAGRADAERIAYAEGALEIAHGSRSIDLEDEADPELLSVTDLLDADRLAARQFDVERLTAAQRAAADRTWAFGHIIVDEAQELSPMAWRLLMRRSPNRSMTLVGDVAQTGELAGAAAWGPVLAPYVADRWRLTELTVNYRTPAEIMAVAAEVLGRIDPASTAPASIRSTGVPPWDRTVPAADLPAELAAAVRVEWDAVADGRVGVIVPADTVSALGAAVRAAVPGTALGDQPDLQSPVVVLTVRQAKGLEFDAVVVVDPDRIVAASPRGLSDLYVALTRATQRLGVLRVA